MLTNMDPRVVITALLISLPSCSRAVEEPEPEKSHGPTEPRETLIWTPPATWTIEKTAKNGLYRAKYTIPKAGDSKHPADVLVTYLGRPREAELDQKVKEWLAGFEQLTSEPEHTTITVGEMDVQVDELAGTYKFPLGPPAISKSGKKTRHAAHMLKTGWRGMVASVKASNKETWFFELVGPDDTVQAARSAFLNMLRSVSWGDAKAATSSR